MFSLYLNIRHIAYIMHDDGGTKMKVKCVSDRRDMLLYVLESELGEKRIYHPLPDFSYSVGDYNVDRRGYISVPSDELDLFSALARLGLCEGDYIEQAPDDSNIYYYYDNSRVQTLINLFSIISARYLLINKALAAQGAFFISKQLMQSILAHPPLTTHEFLQMIYRRDDDYRGIMVSNSYVSFPGFSKAPLEDAYIHRQLADCIMNVAKDKLWVKPFTKRSRNRKYVMRTWLNSIGMVGPCYDYARKTMLSRLNGYSDQKKKEETHV